MLFDGTVTLSYNEGDDINIGSIEMNGSFVAGADVNVTINGHTYTAPAFENMGMVGWMLEGVGMMYPEDDSITVEFSADISTEGENTLKIVQSE